MSFSWCPTRLALGQSLAILLFLLSGCRSAQWESVQPLYSTESASVITQWRPLLGTLGSVWTDGKLCWAVGAAGLIMHSPDCEHWTSQTAEEHVNLYAVFGSSPESLWAVGAAGAILHTSDGEHWSKRVTGTTVELGSVFSTKGDLFVPLRTLLSQGLIIACRTGEFRTGRRFLDGRPGQGPLDHPCVASTAEAGMLACLVLLRAR
jgi:hypothetical protein